MQALVTALKSLHEVDAYIEGSHNHGGRPWGEPPNIEVHSCSTVLRRIGTLHISLAWCRFKVCTVCTTPIYCHYLGASLTQEPGPLDLLLLYCSPLTRKPLQRPYWRRGLHASGWLPRTTTCTHKFTHISCLIGFAEVTLAVGSRAQQLAHNFTHSSALLAPWKSP